MKKILNFRFPLISIFPSIQKFNFSLSKCDPIVSNLLSKINNQNISSDPSEIFSDLTKSFNILNLSEMKLIFNYAKSTYYTDNIMWKHYFNRISELLCKETDEVLIDDLIEYVCNSDKPIREEAKSVFTNLIFSIETEETDFSSQIHWLRKILILNCGISESFELDRNSFDFGVNLPIQLLESVLPLFEKFISADVFNKLSIDSRLEALHLFSSLILGTNSEEKLISLYKNNINSILSEISKLSSDYLTLLSSIMLRMSEKTELFWLSLEKELLFGINSLSISCLLKVLENFARSKQGSTRFYLEIDRLIGFNIDSFNSEQISIAVRSFAIQGNPRQKLLRLLMKKTEETTNFANVSDCVWMLWGFAKCELVTERIWSICETKIIENAYLLNDYEIIHILDALNLANKDSEILKNCLRNKIGKILSLYNNEEIPIVVLAAFLKNIEKEEFFVILEEKLMKILKEKPIYYVARIVKILDNAEITKGIFKDEFYNCILQRYLINKNELNIKDEKDYRLALRFMGFKDKIQEKTENINLNA